MYGPVQWADCRPSCWMGLVKYFRATLLGLSYRFCGLSASRSVVLLGPLTCWSFTGISRGSVIYVVVSQKQKLYMLLY